MSLAFFAPFLIILALVLFALPLSKARNALPPDANRPAKAPVKGPTAK